MGASSSKGDRGGKVKRWSKRLSLRHFSIPPPPPPDFPPYECDGIGRTVSDVVTDTSWMRRRPEASHDVGTYRPTIERTRSEIVRPSVYSSRKSFFSPPDESVSSSRASTSLAPSRVSQVGSRQIRQKVSKPDTDYIDYTVVPLLLRSGISYQQATDYGEHLAALETQEDVECVMSAPETLVKDLVLAGIRVSETCQLKLETDRFWSASKETPDRNRNRKSYVYYRSSERVESLREEIRARKSLADFSMSASSPQLLRSRSSVSQARPRSEYRGGRTDFEDDDNGRNLTAAELDHITRLIKASKANR